MADRKFQHLPLRERSQLDQVLCVLYLLEDIFLLGLAMYDLCSFVCTCQPYQSSEK